MAEAALLFGLVVTFDVAHILDVYLQYVQNAVVGLLATQPLDMLFADVDYPDYQYQVQQDVRQV